MMRRSRQLTALGMPGGLTWGQLAALTATALATDGCVGWPVCIYNPDLDPGRAGADAIISYITQAITARDQPAH
jgi:arginase family enzyme